MSAGSITPTTLRFKLVNSTFILVHSQEPPSDEEWDAVLATVNENKQKIQHIFVATQGGGPNASQRSRYNLTMEKFATQPKIAVLGANAIVRGIVTAITWARKEPMKMFALDDVREAADFLGLSAMDHAAVATQVRKFRSELKF